MMACGRFTSLLGVALLLAAVVPSGRAEDYPGKPIRLIVPFAAGSVSDSVARLTAERASPQLGVPIIVENRPGATGTIGAGQVAKSKPDGYTVLYGAVSSLVMLPATGAKLTFDPVKDLAPVTLIGRGELVLVVPPSLAVRSISELITLAKTQPGRLSYGTMGIGSSPHFAGALLAKQASIETVDIHYKGNNEALLDLLAGRIQFAFDYPLTSVPHIRAGKLRALMVTSAKRIEPLPDVPTASELGLPELEIETWAGYFVPAGTSKSIVDRLNAAFVYALSDSQVRTKLRGSGFEADLRRRKCSPRLL